MNVFMITAEASQVMLIVLGYFLFADLRIDNEREKAGTRRLNNGGELSFMTMALHLSTVRQVDQAKPKSTAVLQRVSKRKCCNLYLQIHIFCVSTSVFLQCILFEK